MPRIATVIAGWSGETIGMSEITATSAANAAGARASTQQPRAADLLLALEHDAHVDRQRAARREQSLDRLHVHPQLALVVGGAAAVELVAAHDRRKRRMMPVIAGGWTS